MEILDRIKSVIGLDEVDKFRTAGAEQKENTKAFQKSEAWINRKEEARQVAQMGDGHRSLYYQKTFASKGQKSLDELKLAVDMWQERGDSASTAIAAHTLDTTAEEGIEKQLKQLEEKHENLGEDLGALANAVLELAIKTGVAKTDSVLEGKTVNDLIILCEKMDEDAAVKRELVEIIKEAGVAEEEGIQYEKFEKEHSGDYDKKTGTYEPKAQRSHEVKQDRASLLEQRMKDAEVILKGPDYNFNGEKTAHDAALENLKHAEYGLAKLAKGQTLESDVKEVLKMGPKARKKYYRGVLKDGGPEAANELTAAVKKQRTKSNVLEM